MLSTSYDNDVMMEATTNDVDDEDDDDTRHCRIWARAPTFTCASTSYVAVDTFFFSACGLPAGDQPHRPVSDQKIDDQKYERNHFANAADH